MNVKAHIRDKEGIPLYRQQLTFMDMELEDGRALCSYSMQTQSNLCLVCRPAPPRAPPGMPPPASLTASAQLAPTWLLAQQQRVAQQRQQLAAQQRQLLAAQQ